MRRWVQILALALVPAHALAGEFFTLPGHGGPIKGIAVSPDGQSILTASFDSSVGLWGAQTPTWLEAHRAAVNTVLFVDDTRAVSSGDDFDLYLWNLQSSESQLLGGHKGKVLSLATSPDGKTVASASWDGAIGLWSLSGAEPPKMITGHSAGVNDVVFSDDGALLYSASADGTIRVWDANTGAAKRLLLKNSFGVNTLELNGAAGWLAYGAVDGVTRVVSTDDARPLADFTLDRRPVLAMAATRDFRRLAIGDGEGYISVLDTNDWSIIADFRATARGPIWALAFSADGSNIHAGGLDDALYSWPLDGIKDAPRMVQDERTFLNGNDASSNGERQFNRKCSICHSLTSDTQRRAGPTLRNLFGRKAGTLAGYSYSETLLRADIVWDDHTIDVLFDLGPDVYIQGTKMPMQRITAKKDRSDLITFLRKFSQSKEN